MYKYSYLYFIKQSYIIDMKKNYFVDAYIKTKSTDFIINYIKMMEEYVPYLKDNKLNYKEKTINPQQSLKRHIFINNGRQS